MLPSRPPTKATNPEPNSAWWRHPGRSQRQNHSNLLPRKSRQQLSAFVGFDAAGHRLSIASRLGCEVAGFPPHSDLTKNPPIPGARASGRRQRPSVGSKAASGCTSKTSSLTDCYRGQCGESELKNQIGFYVFCNFLERFIPGLFWSTTAWRCDLCDR